MMNPNPKNIFPLVEIYFFKFETPFVTPEGKQNSKSIFDANNLI